MGHLIRHRSVTPIKVIKKNGPTAQVSEIQLIQRIFFFFLSPDKNFRYESDIND